MSISGESSQLPIEWEFVGKLPFLVWKFRLLRALNPSDLKDIIPALEEDLFKAKNELGGLTLIATGRGPIWLYGAVISIAYPIFDTIAVYDPRQGGAVIVVNHEDDSRVGDLVKPEGVSLE